MGKISSSISAIIGIGIVAFLIYYCCLRRKRQRNNGTVVTVTNSRLQPAVPNISPTTPYNHGQYPYPTGNYAQGQPVSGIYPGAAPMGGYPYPSQNNPYPSYPPTSGTGMPMPMLDNANHLQSAPYPTAPPQFNDLPPPYSDVTKR